MAKQTILTERGTGEVMYPQTLASLVKTSDGGNVDEGLEKATLEVFKKLWTEATKSVCRAGVTYGGINDDGLPILYDEVLTWDEAVRIYNISHKTIMGKATAGAYYFGWDKYGRFFLPLRVQSHECSLAQAFTNAVNLEAVAIDCWSGELNLNPGNGAFSGCSSLKRIIGNFHSQYLSSDMTDIFKGCRALREVRFWSNTSFSFADSPLLSLESVAHLLNRLGDGTITITVHPDVYAKLTGDTTNEAAAALTEEEAAAWQQVLADAVEKNISFATA